MYLCASQYEDIVSMTDHNSMQKAITHLTRVGLFTLLFFAAFQTAGAQQLTLRSKMPAIEQIVIGIDGSNTSLNAHRGNKGTVVVFWSNECPWASKVEDRLVALQREFAPKGFSFVLVNSNDAKAFPKEAIEEARKRGYPMTYIVDTGSRVAKAFGAARTPEVFVFSANDELVYSGTIDDSPGDPNNVKQRYLHQALTQVLNGQPVNVPQTKAFGCTIRTQG